MELEWASLASLSISFHGLEALYGAKCNTLNLCIDGPLPAILCPTGFAVMLCL